MIINELEISKTNQARCQRCDKKILKETPRGISYSFRRNYTTKSFSCWKCCKIIFEREKTLIKVKEKELKKMIKQQGKYLILDELNEDVP